MSYYDILGVNKTATAAEIKSAYRKKTMEWHPDRNKSSDASQKFKEINAAYEVLSDSKKKSHYDQVGHDSFNRNGGSSAAGGNPYANSGSPFGGAYSSSAGFDMSDFGDIFETFFGGSSGGRQRKPVYEIAITFEEAYNGVEKEVNIAGSSRTLKIPAGVDTGNKMRFNDFDLVIQVRPSSLYKREGQDLYLEKEITFTQAVLGGTIAIKTIKGSIDLKLRAGTQHGTAVRLRGEGMPYPNSNGKGDLYIIYKLTVPEKLSSRARKLLEELQNEL
jgi:DnaJ-class molecular chaperone